MPVRPAPGKTLRCKFSTESYMALSDKSELLRLLDAEITRRGFVGKSVQGAGAVFIGSQLGACGSSSSGSSQEPQPPPPPAIPAASAEYSALKRTSFGVQQPALQAMQQSGVTNYLEQQLDYTNIDDGDLEAQVNSRFPLVAQTPTQLLTGFPDNIGDVAVQMTGASQFRQMYSERQLYEVMVEFWSNHFNIHLLNGLGPTLKPADDINVVRQHALGNFRDLLHASAKSASMLFYLDNYLNLASSPNENYARELMELHTLGVDGGYTEDDVKEVARCFTGWTIRFPGDASGAYGTFKFESSIHDDNAKTVLGNMIAAGQGQAGAEQVLDLLAAHPATAQYIARKLCIRFIGDDPPQSAVDAVATAFQQSAGDIKETLRALFASDAFLQSADEKFIRPAEYLAAMVRSLVPTRIYPSDNGVLFFFAQSILGQLPHYWPTPDGYPDDNAYWANTGNMLNRWRLAYLAIANVIPDIDVFGLDYAVLLGGADTAGSVVDNIVANVLMRPISDSDRALILGWLADEYNVAETDPLPAATAEFVAGLVATVLFSSAYFQLR